MKYLEALRLAVSFLTQIPIASSKELSKETWARSTYFFTCVGFIYGITNILIYIISSKLNWDKDLSIWIIISGNILLSASLHLDGWMDCFDAFGSKSKTREDILRILKDSRSGAFAVIAAIIIIGLQFLSLRLINSTTLIMVLFFAPVLARFMMFLILLAQNPSKQEGSLIYFLERFSPLKAITLNSLFLIIGLTLLNQYWNIGFFIKLTLVLLLGYTWGLFLKHKLQAHNGDSLGSILVFTETAWFFLFAVCP